jgi:glycosyltransferase involved in cell wall biosynthesis
LGYFILAVQRMMASAGLKLAVLTTSYPLSEESVSGVFVRRLVDHISQQNNIVVVTPAGVTAPEPGGINIKSFRYAPATWQILAHNPGGIPVALKRNRWLYFLLPSFLISMAWHIARQGKTADVVHANWAICGAVAGMMGTICGFPVITTLRGEDVTRARHSWLDKLLLRVCIRTNKKVVGVSQAIVDWLKECHPEDVEKFCLVPNGVEGAFFDFPRTGALQDKPLHIITIGSLIPRKGMDVIIRALSELDDPRCILTIVGEGPEHAQLLALTRTLGLEEQIRFIGEMPPSAIVGLLGQADIFVLASYSEGRPNALLEAMATGLPIVASNIEGVQELVTHGHNGLLFPAGAASALALQIKSLLSDREMRVSMGQHGRQSLKAAGLIWSETARRYNALYRMVAKGK